MTEERREPATPPAGAAVDEHGREEPHERRAARVADGFDPGVRIRMERRADGDPTGIIDSRVARAGADDHLRVRAAAGAAVRAAESGSLEQRNGAENAGGEHEVVRLERPALLAKPRARALGLDEPSVALSAKEGGRAFGVDHGACVLGEPEVVAVERVLRAVPATDHAAPA